LRGYQLAYKLKKENLELYNLAKRIKEERGLTWDEAIPLAEEEYRRLKEEEEERETCSKAFRLFEEGKGPADAVMEGLCTPEKARELYKSYVKLKNLPDTTLLEALGRAEGIVSELNALKDEIGKLRGETDKLSRRVEEMRRLLEEAEEIRPVLEELSNNLPYLKAIVQNLPFIIARNIQAMSPEQLRKLMLNLLPNG